MRNILRKYATNFHLM